jgi:hypothetical protein
MQLSKVGVYLVKDGKIVCEEFLLRASGQSSRCQPRGALQVAELDAAAAILEQSFMNRRSKKQ